MASYSLEFIQALSDSHAESLSQAIAWIKHLEQSNATLQQQVNQQTQKFEQQNQHLNDMLVESKRVQQHLVQMEKMSMLGQMLAGISHEISNPITFIYGNLPYIEEHVQDLLKILQVYQTNCSKEAASAQSVQTVLNEVDLDFVLEDLPRIVDSMKVGADRMRELVLTLRNFYRLDEPEMKPADLHTGIEDTLLLLQHRYKQEIQIIKEFGNIPPVECHINQINQVFMNLLSNAIDALLELSVDIDESVTDEPVVKQIIIKTEMMSQDWVAISICDNGAGIPLEIQNRLFEAFFTTKPIGIGTGLGLSISHQIITENHKGHIYCCSAPAGGTTFMVELPVRQSSEFAT